MARFDRLTVYNTLLADGLVPLFYHGSVDISLGAANAIAAGDDVRLAYTGACSAGANPLGNAVFTYSEAQ